MHTSGACMYEESVGDAQHWLPGRPAHNMLHEQCGLVRMGVRAQHVLHGVATTHPVHIGWLHKQVQPVYGSIVRSKWPLACTIMSGTQGTGFDLHRSTADALRLTRSRTLALAKAQTQTRTHARLNTMHMLKLQSMHACCRQLQQRLWSSEETSELLPPHAT
jgi:hypothetical protein